MKRILLFLTVLLAAATLSSAQQQTRFNPDLTWNTLRAGYGVRIPMNSDLAPDGKAYSLSYIRRFAKHWGWRTGFEYQTENMGATNGVGLPTALVFRTNTYGFRDGVRNAVVNSAADLAWDSAMGYSADQMRNDVFANILFILFRRAEFFVGVTPGYLLGDEPTSDSVYVVSDGARTTPYIQTIELNRRFSLSADAGCTFSIPLWRFSLDITPAFHYLITDNFSERHQEMDPATNIPVGTPVLKPLRWQFSLDFGLSYLF